jgi:hypothetical protein
MFSYGLLEVGCYYLVQEEKDSPVTLIKVTMESDHCMYILRYEDTLASEWKKKTDGINDIIECLTDEAVRTWEKQYNSEDAYYEEDDE